MSYQKLKGEVVTTKRTRFEVKIPHNGIVLAKFIAGDFSLVPADATLCGFNDDPECVTFIFRHEEVIVDADGKGPK